MSFMTSLCTTWRSPPIEEPSPIQNGYTKWLLSRLMLVFHNSKLQLAEYIRKTHRLLLLAKLSISSASSVLIHQKTLYLTHWKGVNHTKLGIYSLDDSRIRSLYVHNILKQNAVLRCLFDHRLLLQTKQSLLAVDVRNPRKPHGLAFRQNTHKKWHLRFPIRIAFAGPSAFVAGGYAGSLQLILDPNFFLRISEPHLQMSTPEWMQKRRSFQRVHSHISQ